MAKNKIKRSLSAICDPHPSKSEENKLWEYFGLKCAYCDCEIERSSRTGHLDHLVPISEGGTNSIFNHALSCATCNGDEKREEPWESFLRRKNDRNDAFKERREKICKWINRSPKTYSESGFAIKRDSIIQEALCNFDASVAEMRKLRSCGI